MRFAMAPQSSQSAPESVCKAEGSPDAEGIVHVCICALTRRITIT